MKRFLAACALIPVLSAHAHATTVDTFTSVGAFDAATTAQQTTAFSTPCAICNVFYVGTSYTRNGINFSANAPGMNINSAAQQKFPAATLSNVYQSDATGSDTLIITLPTAVTAFGVDFAESTASSGITMTIGNGSNTLFTVPNLGTDYTEQFEGFTSSTAFNTITISDAQPDGWFIFDVKTAVAAVPETSTWAMMLLGFCGLGCMAYRKKNSLRYA